MTEKSLPKLDWRVVFNRAVPPGSRGWGRVRAAQLKQMGPAMTVAAWGQAARRVLLSGLGWVAIASTTIAGAMFLLASPLAALVFRQPELAHPLAVADDRPVGDRLRPVFAIFRFKPANFDFAVSKLQDRTLV